MMWALVAIILAVTAAMILGTRSPNRMPPRDGDERFDGSAPLDPGNLRDRETRD